MKFPRIDDLYGFVKDALSEANGTASFSRLSAAGIILSTLGWVTYLVVKNHSLPDLSGPTLFMTSGSAATYGANKASDVIKRATEKTPDVPPATTTPKRDDKPLQPAG